MIPDGKYHDHKIPPVWYSPLLNSTTSQLKKYDDSNVDYVVRFAVFAIDVDNYITITFNYF